MSRIRDRYKQQMNQFCEKNNQVSAEDILLLAQQPAQDVNLSARAERKLRETSKEATVNRKAANTENKYGWTKGFKRLAWGSIVAAASLLLVTTTTLAATGTLDDIFRTVFKDEVTAEIIEEGYLHEVDKVLSEGEFEVNFKAVTGDWSYPKLLFEVKVNDASLEDYDRIELEAYILGIEQYHNEIDNYATCIGYGQQDATNKDIYVVNMDGPMTWIVNEEEFIVDIRKITFQGQDLLTKEYDVNMVCQHSVPMQEFRPAIQENHYEKPIYYEGVTYLVRVGVYGMYDSQVCMGFDYLESDLLKEIAKERGIDDVTQISFYDVEEVFVENWHAMGRDAILVVDGKEYRALPDNDQFYPYCDTKVELGIPNRCYGRVFMQAIDYESATSVKFRLGDEEVTLK